MRLLLKKSWTVGKKPHFAPPKRPPFDLERSWARGPNSPLLIKPSICCFGQRNQSESFIHPTQQAALDWDASNTRVLVLFPNEDGDLRTWTCYLAKTSDSMLSHYGTMSKRLLEMEKLADTSIFPIATKKKKQSWRSWSHQIGLLPMHWKEAPRLGRMHPWRRSHLCYDREHPEDSLFLKGLPPPWVATGRPAKTLQIATEFVISIHSFNSLSQ